MTPTTLVNFNCPTDLKRQFDAVVRRKNLSKTSVILMLIEGYIREDVKARQQFETAYAATYDDEPLAIFTNDDDWQLTSGGF